MNAELVLALREHLVELLDGGGAHIGVIDALKNFPPDKRGLQPPELPYSAWQLVEHIRIAQWDIVEFCLNPAHESPPWPEGYWPDTEAPPKQESWTKSLKQIDEDLARMERFVRDPKTELLTPLPHGDGQTPAREAMLLADHNAYHLGQLIAVRRLLDAWPP